MLIDRLLRRRSSTEKQTSQTVCFAPIGGCLIACEDKVLSAGDWRPRNAEQVNFLKRYYYDFREVLKTLPELESLASESADEVSRFLSDRGFSISIDRIDPPGIGVASVFKLLLEWVRPGTTCWVRNKEYPAVRIGRNHQFFSSKHAQNPIVSIVTRNGDVVRMTAFDHPPHEFELAELVREIDRSAKPNNDFNGVIFPMITYNEQIDISWVHGMETQGIAGPWIISQAIQQTKFRMNEFGAKVESAVAMGVLLGYCPGPPPKPDLIIDKPFLLWIKREGLEIPLFIGHFAEEHWKNPGKLD